MENSNKMSCVLLIYLVEKLWMAFNINIMNNPGDDGYPEVLNRWEPETKVGGF